LNDLDIGPSTNLLKFWFTPPEALGLFNTLQIYIAHEFFQVANGFIMFGERPVVC